MVFSNLGRHLVQENHKLSLRVVMMSIKNDCDLGFRNDDTNVCSSTNSHFHMSENNEFGRPKRLYQSWFGIMELKGPKVNRSSFYWIGMCTVCFPQF